MEEKRERLFDKNLSRSRFATERKPAFAKKRSGMEVKVKDNKEYKRRVHYSGTHPKRFEEKYKEANPEKYGDTIEKVISKGNTPAGMHISICVNEILEFLQIKPGQIGLDATLGYGGHTLQMMKCLEHTGHMYALDIDPIESEKTRVRLEKQGYGSDILTIKQMNFRDIDKIADEVGKFDFVLADLGVSSMQIDNPERGFTYKYDGPLDLRLNLQKGKPAYEILKEILFWNYIRTKAINRYFLRIAFGKARKIWKITEIRNYLMKFGHLPKLFSMTNHRLGVWIKSKVFRNLKP